MLVELKLRDVLNATHVCVLNFWAHKAGAVGGTSQLAMSPGKQTGEYSRHFDQVTAGDQTADDVYKVNVSRRSRVDPTKWLADLPVRPPHEAMQSELAENPHLRAALANALAAKELPPLYYARPLVQAAPECSKIHPLCMYMDGVAFDPWDLGVPSAVRPPPPFGGCAAVRDVGAGAEDGTLCTPLFWRSHGPSEQ